MEGQGFKPDRSKAMDWYLKEVMKGHSATQFRIGRKFDEGPGVLDYTKALQWYRLSATQGNVAGQFKVGEIAANQGHMDSQIRVSNFYTLGRGVPKDLIKAFEWTDKVIATPTATWRRLRQDLVRGLNADDEREAAPSGKRNRSSVAEK
ncbi:hypothetical protein BGX33_005205 [Mortierella sp. NVP41]|nr:hypothetical protein BGX33_005205 [Mortierella sp. NVP41]